MRNVLIIVERILIMAENILIIVEKVLIFVERILIKIYCDTRSFQERTSLKSQHPIHVSNSFNYFCLPQISSSNAKNILMDKISCNEATNIYKDQRVFN